MKGNNSINNATVNNLTKEDAMNANNRVTVTSVNATTAKEATMEGLIKEVQKQTEDWAKKSNCGSAEDSAKYMDMMKERFDGFVNDLVHLTGVYQVASYIGHALDDSISDDGKVDIKAMGRELYEIIMDEAEELETYGDSDSLMKAMRLKAFVGGKEEFRSVFSILISGMLYVSKVVSGKLNKLTPGMNHPIIFLGVQSLKGIAKGLIGLGKAVLKGVTYMMSFVVAGVTKAFWNIASFVMACFNAVKYRREQLASFLHKEDGNDDYDSMFDPENIYDDIYEGYEDVCGDGIWNCC